MQYVHFAEKYAATNTWNMRQSDIRLKLTRLPRRQYSITERQLQDMAATSPTRSESPVVLRRSSRSRGEAAGPRRGPRARPATSRPSPRRSRQSRRTPLCVHSRRPSSPLPPAGSPRWTHPRPRRSTTTATHSRLRRHLMPIHLASRQYKYKKLYLRETAQIHCTTNIVINTHTRLMALFPGPPR